MDVCQQKHSELVAHVHKFTGIVVRRGDVVKVKLGFQAVFTAEGASRLAVARLMDTSLDFLECTAKQTMRFPLTLTSAGERCAQT